jgi:OOP family OmpA-OmpF porin
MSHRTVAACTAAALLAVAPLGAQSSVSFDVGTYGSFTRFDRSLFLDDGLGFGARLGMGFEAAGHSLRFETELARSGSERAGASVVYAPSRLRLVYPVQLPDDRITVLLGAGGVRSRYSGNATSTVDFGLSGMATVQVRLTERVALRVDGSTDYMGAPSNEQPNMPSNWNSTIAIGASMPLDVAKRSRRAPGPTEAASPAPTRAPARAPAAADPVNVDADADDVLDARDRCAGTPRGTVVDGNGCPLPPDSDRDGVVDPSDRCANTPAGTTVDGTGCAPLFERTIRTITLRGVTFQSGRAELTEGSLGVLEKVAAQLLASPEVRLEVAGHSDGIGARSSNIRLSLERAESVRAHLVALGVAEDRLVARGYGPDEPAGSNATTDGRAMNRRVELRRID